jgi:hypothetical protein
MTALCFTDNPQIDEQESFWEDLEREEQFFAWDDDQELEAFSLECCFGPEE